MLHLRVALLRVVEGPDRWLEVEVGADPLVLGSHEACDLRLTDPTVSSRHAEIVLAPTGFLLRDLGSKNGVRVNGLRTERVYLGPGTTIRLGRTVVEVHDAGRVEAIELTAQRRFGRLVGDSLVMRRLYVALESAAAAPARSCLHCQRTAGSQVFVRPIAPRTRFLKRDVCLRSR
jgi:hypothetical protein